MRKALKWAERLNGVAIVMMVIAVADCVESYAKLILFAISLGVMCAINSLSMSLLIKKVSEADAPKQEADNVAPKLYDNTENGGL